MTLDLVFNLGLLLFSLYCFVYIGITTPDSGVNELGAAFWPRIILVLLAILLIANIVNIIKKNKAENIKSISISDLKGFFTSKLFYGMIIIATMAFLLKYLGFMLTVFLFMMAYCYLLGEKRPHILIIVGVVVTIILYIMFYGFLGIILPRGEGFLREISLQIETIFRSIKSIF